MRTHLEKQFDFLLRALFLLFVFIIPFKFGVPYLEQESFLFPYSLGEWFLLPYWPIEFFVFISISLFLIWMLKTALNPRMLWNLPLTLFLLFMILVFLGCLTSVYPYASKLIFFQFLSYFLLFFLAVQLTYKNESFLKLTCFVVLFSGVLIALFGIYQHYWGLQDTLEWIQNGKGGEPVHYNVISRLSGGRVFSTFIYPNSLAGYLLLILPLSFAAVYFRNKITLNQWILFLGLLLASAFSFLFIMNVNHVMAWVLTPLGILLFPMTLLLCLGFTFSKGGIAAALLAAILILVWQVKKIKGKVIWVLVSLAGLSAVFIFLNKDFIFHRLQMSTLMYRIDYWKAALGMFAGREFFGSGLGTFGVLYPTFKPLHAQDTQLAHNDFMQLIVETGLCGFLFLLSIFCLLFYATFIKKNGKGLFHVSFAVAFLAVFIHHFADFDLYISGIGGIEWILFGILTLQVLPVRTMSLSSFISKTGLVLAGVLFVFAQTELIYQLKAKKAFDMARQYLELKKPEKAMDWIDKAISKQRDNAHYYFLKGQIHKALADPKSAIFSFKTAAQINPYWAPPYILQTQYWLGEWKREPSEKNLSELLTVWKKGVNLMPSKVEERVKLALFLEKIGHLEEALIEYRAVLGKQPDNKEIQNKCRVLGQKLNSYFKDQA